MQELLLLQGAQPDLGLQKKAAQLAEAGNLSLRIVSVTKAESATADDAVIARALVSKTENARVILAPATVRLRSIMPMLAYHLQAGLTADCTALKISGSGQLLQTRPAFGNSLMATIQTVSPVQMATVRPGTFPADPEGEYPQPEELALCDTGLVTILQQLRQTAACGLGQATVIVSGGAGIGSKEGFEKLGAFAEKIGAALGASRNAVDLGFAPYSAQVGITGATVSPRLYLAVGISGAVQHLSGMSGAETVIAINQDPKAPIFQYADYGIVGDWEIIIHQLEELL